MKAEPKTILYFLSNYFDTIKALFEVQSKEGFIKRERLQQILKDNDTAIEPQLHEYKILKKVGDDFEIRGVYFNFFEFVFNEFRPLLPETIEKYAHSISELFKKIREGISKDRNILMQRLNDLYSEIKDFSESVEKNTLRLLVETRELKSNVDKIDYQEKVRKASFWIDYYISPLNQILDVNHTQSITNRLFDISNYVNVRRLNFDDEMVRLQFEKLYNFLVQTNDDLLRQSKILTNELLPLIERIRTENMILTGWIEFLKKPYKAQVPRVFKLMRNYPYSNDMYYNAKEYMEQFAAEDVVIIDEQAVDANMWLFNKERYREQMMSKLPLDNFFDWCGTTLRSEYKTVETDKFFALTTLLFEDGIMLEFDTDADKKVIRTSHMTLRVPPIKVLRYGIS
jgi:hypothetical protein